MIVHIIIIHISTPISEDQLLEMPSLCLPSLLALGKLVASGSYHICFQGSFFRHLVMHAMVVKKKQCVVRKEPHCEVF